MSPTLAVDEKAKESLIMCKNIRQATCKILQRPSYFEGQNILNSPLNKNGKEHLYSKPTRTTKLKESTIEKNFELTLKSNVTGAERISNYEYEFEKLHKNEFIGNNLYEEIEEVPPYQPKR